MKKVILYTKLNCHLCMDAYRLLMEVACELPLEIDVVDITHSHNMDITSKYATRIPVVALPDTNAELDWPFALEKLRAYLED